MIQLKRSSSGSYELTDKKQVVKLKEKTISLGEYQINTPGEYEQGGVEVIYSQSAALLVWDHLQIAYIFEATKPDAFEKNQFSSTDVLLLSEEIKEISKDQLTMLIDSYDPRAVIISSQTEIEKSYKENIKPLEQSPIKLSAQALPVEGRDYLILSWAYRSKRLRRYYSTLKA